MSIETQEQALAEARKRWGDCAAVLAAILSSDVFVFDGINIWRAVSWDAAFANADKREGK